ncbi:MAG TPA: IS200/IS605 family transposase [Blastocatellia bacterium]|nr:IS200/IS605 family transposase [Blastocatellia bacterium]
MPQSLSAALMHLVFSTKLREPWIFPEIEQELYAYLAEVFKGCKSPSLSIGGDKDHIHALFSLARTWTIADVVEEVKKRSSKWMKTKDESLKNFHWQGGYGVFSIGESNVPALKRYIANQKDHHKRTSYQDEFRSLLRKYKVSYDERYVWD